MVLILICVLSGLRMNKKVSKQHIEELTGIDLKLSRKIHRRIMKSKTE